MKLSQLNTEQRNKNTLNIDTLPTLEALKLINQEDKLVPEVISQNLDKLSDIIDYLWENFNEGRLFYCGAGTSGRLAVVDASEVPPTFGVAPGKIIGLIAGGEQAFITAVEGSEDDETACERELKEYGFNEKDSLVGIASSGRTPYVVGGLKYAKSIGARTVSIANSKNAVISSLADKSLELITGPEVITGSTRMKAGTSQKLVLNMISTMLMIRFGKVYSNLMVDVAPTNQKLIDRAKRIIIESCDVDEEKASQLFEKANKSVKHAIVMALLNIDVNQADELLKKNNNRISDIIHQEKN